MAVKSATLALLCATALSACGIDFVAVDPAPPTFVVVETEHGESLTASVEVQSRNVLRVPVVVVSGDTLEVEVLSDGRAFFTTSLSPDSLDPYIHLRIEPEEGALDVPLPVLVRSGSAHRDSDGQLVLPVNLPQTGQDIQSIRWILEFVSADGPSTVAVLGSGPLTGPLSFPMNLIPPEATKVSVSSLVQLETGSTWADVVLSGRVFFTIPDS